MEGTEYINKKIKLNMLKLFTIETHTEYVMHPADGWQIEYV